jgi:hypothetical protein
MLLWRLLRPEQTPVSTAERQAANGWIGRATSPRWAFASVRRSFSAPW